MCLLHVCPYYTSTAIFAYAEQGLRQWKSPFKEKKQGLFLVKYIMHYRNSKYVMLKYVQQTQVIIFVFNRWREEAEMESIRYQERVQQLEKEKSDVSLALKKKLDALEVSKTNEISRLQDIHL